MHLSLRNRLIGGIVIVGIVGTSSAQELLWDNNLVPNGSRNGALSPPLWPDIRRADDIIVPEPGWVITDYNFNAIEEPGWVHSGLSQVYIYTDDKDRPSQLLVQQIGPDKRVFTGKILFERPNYDYFVTDLDIRLNAGKYWIGVRDPEGSGGDKTTNFYVTSDGGPDGGCEPEHHGTCRTGYFSLDAGKTWLNEGIRTHHSFEVLGNLLCSGDVENDGSVGFHDLLAVLSAWGPYDACPPHIPEDIDQDCDVDLDDLLAVLSNWGSCPE